ncbi:MAG: DUF2029 domain-containing protein [Tatlockia sp.]|nr:DUF2029 domain-containing protein [Tatlockia sp.]
MTNRRLGLIACLIVTLVYCLIFYYVLSSNNIQDFTSFYAAIVNLVEHKNPYAKLSSHFLPLTKRLSANLNPPFALYSFSFLAQFSYKLALGIWIFLSFALGLIGAGVALTQVFSRHFFREYWLILVVIYLAFFPTLINISTGQFGLILFFLLMIGYHFYLKNNELVCGLFWGLAVALKFFPALLFLFLLKQRRMKAFFAMFAMTSLALGLPSLIYGTEIYSQYFSMLSRVFWYGDNWNASLLGYLFRLFYDNPFMNINLRLIKFIYIFLFIIFILYYLKKMQKNTLQEINHQPFCLSLAMMLILSPLGWLYYFPILTLPLLLVWIKAYKSNFSAMIIVLLCLALINFPQGYVLDRHSGDLFLKIFYYSLSFYGLLLLIYLCTKKNPLLGNNEIHYVTTKQGFILLSQFIFFLGLIGMTFRLIAQGLVK